MKFFISDTHFEHTNIIAFDQRPFSSVAEMREEMIDKWNKRVKKNDEVYILGDFAFSTRAEDWERLLKALNGRKYLIKGNHDYPKKRVEKYFEKICDYLEIKENGKRFILCHYPMVWYNRDLNANTYMLYGHVHDSIEYDQVLTAINSARDDKRSFGYKGKCYNCWCGLFDWAPAPLDKIVAKGEEDLLENKLKKGKI